MQNKSPDRTPNEIRSARTRSALIGAARALFAEKGFADTGTPEIVRRASVTRGALYHHFDDKTALFRGVVEAEAAAVAAEIEASARRAVGPRDALVRGADGYFGAMAAPGRVRLMLIDAPAALGPDALSVIDAATGGGVLRRGLEAAGVDGPVAALADLLSAAFDRAALAIATGADAAAYRDAIRRMIDALAPPDRT
ncbi:MAG: helix-turn-helix domain-containing protein [Marivibrio sp.]|uniref:TetR/AcrR family transcriptional regulator n=1 Tax=Marivibrio sp. TaxID=2039719 RepID=UPI0032F02D04